MDGKQRLRDSKAEGRELAGWGGGALRVLWVISGFCRVDSVFMGVSSGHVTLLLWTKVWVACGFLCGKRGQKGPIRGTPIFGNQVTSGLPVTRKFEELELELERGNEAWGTGF